MPHQSEALAWADDRTAVAFFMEMRLGKSIVSIRWVRKHLDVLAKSGAHVNYLLVAPLTTLGGWSDELMAEGIAETQIIWLTRMQNDYRDIVVKAGPNIARTPRWFLINYEGVRSWKKGVGNVHWHAVILDESTRIKNPQAKTTKVIIQKLSDAGYRAILTGLPNPEGTQDFFSQMQFVNGGAFMGHSNFWTWRERFFIQIGYDWLPRKGARHAIREAVKESAFFMSRKDAKVGSIIVHEKRTVPMNPEQRRMWKDVKQHFRIGTVETKSAGAQFAWMQRIAGGFSPDRTDPCLISPAKYNEIRQLLEGELSGQQLVIWFNFNEELAYVFHTLRKDGFKVGALLGNTPVNIRYLRQRRFQKGEFQVFCIQEALGKFGLDLSAADAELYYSNSWSFEARSQSLQRIVHPKKTVPLLAIDLITEDTTDEDVVACLNDKSITAKTFNSKLIDRIRRRLG